MKPEKLYVNLSKPKKKVDNTTFDEVNEYLTQDYFAEGMQTYVIESKYEAALSTLKTIVDKPEEALRLAKETIELLKA